MFVVLISFHRYYTSKNVQLLIKEKGSTSPQHFRPDCNKFNKSTDDELRRSEVNLGTFNGIPNATRTTSQPGKILDIVLQVDVSDSPSQASASHCEEEAQSSEKGSGNS